MAICVHPWLILLVFSLPPLATGSLTEGAGANVFRTVGTNTVDSAAAVTEWGLLSQAATGGGSLFDRQVFSALNLASGDSLQTTYDLTIG